MFEDWDFKILDSEIPKQLKSKFRSFIKSLKSLKIFNNEFILRYKYIYIEK